MSPMLMSPSKTKTAAHNCHFILHTQDSSQTAGLMTLLVLTFWVKIYEHPEGLAEVTAAVASGSDDDDLETVTSQHE